MANGFTTTLDHTALLAFADQLQPRAAAIVEETLEQIQADIETAMRLPKSGRTYGSHQASAPGDAPAVEEGDLIGSLVVEMTGATEGEIRAEDEKAALLEFGTTRMAARPFMTPAAEANRQPFLDRHEELLGG